ncbi:MAG: PorT family protein [Duncaniella sp.]|nr:PorT family protein [Duncaniella sp.]
MKKVYSLVIMLCMMLAGSGAAHAEMRWGATAGVNFNRYHFKQPLIGGHLGVGGLAGVTGEMMFPGIGFGVELGLLYNNLNSVEDLSKKPIWDNCGSPRIMLHNLTIPFNLKFKWTRMNGVEDYVAPFVVGGPLLDIQLGHNNGQTMKFSGGVFGLRAGLGAEIYKRWQVSANYTWGMTYAMKAKLLTDFAARTGTWDVRVTYFF